MIIHQKEVIKHALIESEKKFKIVFDYIVDLDVTSPLRSKKDIFRCNKNYFKKRGETLSLVMMQEGSIF